MDRIKELEERYQNLTNSILKVRGMITQQEDNLRDDREAMSRLIGRQMELKELIDILKAESNKDVNL